MQFAFLVAMLLLKAGASVSYICLLSVSVKSNTKKFTSTFIRFDTNHRIHHCKPSEMVLIFAVFLALAMLAFGQSPPDCLVRRAPLASYFPSHK